MVIFRHYVFRISEFMHFVEKVVFKLMSKESNITVDILLNGLKTGYGYPI